MEKRRIYFKKAPVYCSSVQRCGRLDMTFADEICEMAETKTTYITDKLN